MTVYSKVLPGSIFFKTFHFFIEQYQEKHPSLILGMTENKMSILQFTAVHVFILFNIVFKGFYVHSGYKSHLHSPQQNVMPNIPLTKPAEITTINSK